MERKAQSEVITTILIILLVLAVIVIVWQVVRSTVEKGAGELETKAKCLEVSLTLSDLKCDATTKAITATVSRANDDVGDVDMKLIVGTNIGTAIDAPLAMGSLTNVDMGTGDTGSNAVKVAAVIGTVTCDPTTPETVSC